MADIKNSSLATGLQAYWDLEEASGTRYDLVGSNNLADNNTVTSATGKIGNCAKFTCANSEYLTVADSAELSIDDGWSISLWFYLDSTQVGGAGDYQYLISKRSGENGIQHWVENVSGTWRLYFGTGTGAFSGTQLSSVAISTNTWYHLVVYHNGASSKVYVNGTQYSLSFNAITDPAVSLNIGGATDTSAWAGYIDDVGIWNNELDSTEVASLYASGSGLPYYDPADVKNDSTLSTSLVSYWKLDETSGTRNDSHGSNHLTDTNTVLYGTGKISNAGDFESSASEYLIDSSPSGEPTGNSARSVSCWCNLESLPSSETVFVPFCYGTDTTNDKWEVWIYNNSGTYRLGVDANSALQTSAGVSISTATWYNITITYNETTLIYYLNGIRVDSDTPTAYTTASSLIRLSGRPNNDSFFDGLIDEVAFYGKALSVAEVRALYGYGTPPVYEATSGSTTNVSHRYGRLPLLGVG